MNSQSSEPKYIGIDLGTTYSAMAWLNPHGVPVTILNTENEPTTPSVVLFEPTGHVVVGTQAKYADCQDAHLIADNIKRDMGQQHYHKRINFRFYSPTALSALILKKLRQGAELHLGPIGGVVITVPAYFNDSQRQATIAAGEIAGLRVIDIINEPTAAAMAYAVREFILKGGQPQQMVGNGINSTVPSSKPHVAMVYDLGGGTFDVSILRIAGDDLTVLATDGEAHLGGCDWDERLVQWACQEFLKIYGIDLQLYPRVLKTLLLDAETAKIALSHSDAVSLSLTLEDKHLQLPLTRVFFDALTTDLVMRTARLVSLVLEAAGLTWNEVDEVLAVGGSSRMPMVLNMLKEITGHVPNCSLPPAEVVAHGAAIHAAILSLRESTCDAPSPSDPFSDISGPMDTSEISIAGHPESRLENTADTTHPTAGDTHGATHGDIHWDDWESEAAADATRRVIAANKADAIYDSTGGIDMGDISELDFNPINTNGRPKKNPLIAAVIESDLSEQHLHLHPDTVANGPDADHPPFDPMVRDRLLRVTKTDVSSHSLGVVVTRSNGNRNVSVLIPRNTALPATATKIYGIMREGQPTVIVQVVEGESPFVEDCVRIGLCKITELPRDLPKGSLVRVTFTLDVSGRLQIGAEELSSNLKVQTSLQSSSGMTVEKIKQAQNAIRDISVS